MGAELLERAKALLKEEPRSASSGLSVAKGETEARTEATWKPPRSRTSVA